MVPVETISVYMVIHFYVIFPSHPPPPPPPSDDSRVNSSDL